MSAGRRVVRATPEFFQDLDRQLPHERTASLPSTADFQAYELLRVVETFATGFDGLPELISGRPEYRVLITAGVLVGAVAVVGQMAPDGAIELVQLDVDAPPLPNDDREDD